MGVMEATMPARSFCNSREAFSSTAVRSRAISDSEATCTFSALSATSAAFTFLSSGSDSLINSRMRSSAVRISFWQNTRALWPRRYWSLVLARSIWSFIFEIFCSCTWISPSHFLRSFWLAASAARSASSLRSCEPRFFSISAMCLGNAEISRLRSARRLSMSWRRITKFKSGSIAVRSVTRGFQRLQFRDIERARGGVKNGDSQRNGNGDVGKMGDASGRGDSVNSQTGGAADRTHDRRRGGNLGGVGRERPAIERAQAPAHQRKQGGSGEQRDGRGGEREAGMPHAGPTHQAPGKCQVDSNGRDTDERRCAAVVERVKGGRKDLGGCVTGQAGAIPGERHGGLMGVVGGEAATLEDGSDDTFPEHGEPDRRRNGEQHGERERTREGGAEFAHAAGGGVAGDGGQSGRGDSGAEQAERQLQEAEGIAQPAHRAIDDVAGGVCDAGCQVEVDGDIDLERGISQDGGNHQVQDLTEPGVTPVEARAVGEAGAPQAGDLPQPLERATREHAASHRYDEAVMEAAAYGVTERESECHRADVEERGGQRGNAEAVAGVEGSHGLRGERDQHQEGTHDAREQHGQLEFAGHGAEPRRQQGDQLRAEDHAQRAHRTHHQDERGCDDIREFGGLAFSLAGEVLGEDRNKGRRKSALGEQVAGEVGNAKGDLEGVVRGAGGEEAPPAHFPHQAGEAAQRNGG